FFIVSALDAFANTASGYRGTVRITSSDGAAILPANHTYTVTDGGVHTFSVTLKTAAASSSITAMDTVTSSITGSQTGITVNPDVAATLQVAGFSNPATAGTAGSVTVTARDAFGNVATGYVGTVAITTDNPNATLPGNHTFAAGESGVHVFAVTLKGASSPSTFSITATDPGPPSITGSQTGITVNPDVATTLQGAGFPHPATAGTPGFVTVTALDQFGNTASGYRGTVTITSNDGAATLPADHTYTLTHAGADTFAVTLETPAAKSSITATAARPPSI